MQTGPGLGSARCRRGEIKSESRSRFCLIGYIGSKVDVITSSCSDRTGMWRCCVLQNRLYNCRISEPSLIITHPVSLLLDADQNSLAVHCINV